MQPERLNLDEISAEDIAELAGVTSSAVSNWSRREADFPEPIRSEGRRKMYDRSEVLAWLERNRPDTHDSDLTANRQLWQLADTARGAVSFTEMVQSVAWLTALVRDLPSVPEDPDELANLARAVAGRSETPLDHIVRTAPGPDLIAQMASLARLIAGDDGLALDRFVEMAATNKPASDGETTDALLDDLVDAACIGDNQNVLDPAAGFGQLLRRVHDRTGAARLEGRYDSDTNLALAAAINAARNAPAIALLAAADGIVPPASHYDRVISVVPYHLGKSSYTERSHTTADPHDPRWEFLVPRSTDSWEAALQRALWETRPDGVVVFAVSNATVSDLSSREARQAATTNGVIETVVSTRHCLPGTNVQLSFMIAARHLEQGGRDHSVLMVDLANDIGSDLPSDWHQWIQGTADPSDQRCARVSVDELARHDFILDPGRYVKPPRDPGDVDDLAHLLVESSANADEQLETLHSVLAMVSVPQFDPQRADWRTLTLGDLVDDKVIHIAVGRGKRTTSRNGQHPLLTARHLDHICDLTPETCDPEEAATESVRSGDLIIRLDHQPHSTMTVTDHHDGWALGSGLARIRPDRAGTATELGWIAAWTTGDQFRADCDRLSHGSTIRRLSPRDLRRIEIPLPPRPVQRAAADYQRIITELEAASCAARRAIDGLIETSTQLLNAHLVAATASELRPAPDVLNGPVIRRRRRSEAARLIFGTRFRLRHKQLDASGRPVGDEFLVYAGAQARLTPASSLPPASKRLRQDLLDQGVLVPDHDTLRLIRDRTFDSPTAAAAVLTGTSTNGLTAWVDDSGQTLKQHLENSRNDQ